MEMKTSELSGAALDWAVAKANGDLMPYGLTDDERYSTEWRLGGPIIERELICIDAGDGSYAPLRKWAAWRADSAPSKVGDEIYGLTPLIAAMRCYVASKLGDTVDIPEELL